jgi:glycosyltransferase involved in cell wall biosynthesis
MKSLECRIFPTVSIVMPTFNRAYIIENSIKSVLSQSYENWELIIVDDGSTDNTRELIESIGDSRIVYVYQENKGPAAARNYALTIAHGKWIAYLDSDNEFFSNYLGTMLSWLSRYPAVVFAIPRSHRLLELYENGKLLNFIDDSGDSPPGIGVKDIFMKSLHLDANGFIHLKRLFDEGIEWDSNLPMMEDWDLAMTMGEKYPYGFLYVEEYLVNYHQRYGGDGIISNSCYADVAEAFERIYHKHKNDTMLAGQNWYPQKVEKWLDLQKEFKAGKQPPYRLYYFQ